MPTQKPMGAEVADTATAASAAVWPPQKQLELLAVLSTQAVAAQAATACAPVLPMHSAWNSRQRERQGMSVVSTPLPDACSEQPATLRQQ